MRLIAAVLCALLAVAAAQSDDLPPVDELVEQMIAGEVTPQQFIDMMPMMSPQYMQDVKTGLPAELRHRISELMPDRAAEDEPAEEQQEDYTDDYGEDAEMDDDMEEDDYAEEEPADEYNYDDEEAEEEEEEDEEEDQDLAPADELIEEEESESSHRPVLRSGAIEDGGAGGSSTGQSAGGAPPLKDSNEILDDKSAAIKLLLYSDAEKTSCQARYEKAYDYYTKDYSLGPNKVSSEVAYLKLWRQLAENASQFDLSNLDRSDLLEVFMLLKNPGVSALDDSQLNDLVRAVTNLETKFASSRVCDFYDDSKCRLNLFKDIRVKMASSTDRDELAHYWLSWRGVVGRGSGKLYADYVRLLDQAAKIRNKDSNAWALMTYAYRHGKVPDILSLLERMWEQQISPLYEQLHSYARIKLRQRYGEDVVPATGPIPAHLLGSHEADDWSALEELMLPFDNATMLDFHGRCIQKSVDVGRLKNVASELYYKLGLNKTSLQELLASRLDVAAPSADSVLFLPRVLDNCRNKAVSSVAIYPTNTTLSDYIELIELFATMQKYKEHAQATLVDDFRFPYKDRLGYNEYGLDLAIGGARALAAITPKGLQQELGFQMFDNSENAAMNLQMVQALKLLPRLAASMAAVRWQADVMTGQISEQQYNDKWWEYKRKYQGVLPVEERDDEQFDAFADGTLTLPNYHLRRLIGGITMFGVHKYHCTMYGAASTPLSECAIFDNEKLGSDIRAVLVSGNMKSLKDQLLAVTGQRELSADPLVQRMQPLADWLVEYNQKHGEEGGATAEQSQMIAIIVGVVIAVIIIGLVIFFIVSRRKQKYQDYKGAPTRESHATETA